MRKHLTLWAALLAATLLLLAGCAPRAGTALSESVDSDQLYVDLPAVVIDFDTGGQASVGGVPVSQLGATAGVDLSALTLPADWVNYFTLAGIQHLQVVNDAEGLTILVNGQPVPSLVWNEGSLVATAETVENLGVALPVLEKILPLVQQLGLGVALRFPVPEGTDAIPLGQISESDTAAQAQLTQQEFLNAVGTPPRINLPVVYDAEGNFTVGDLSAAEWQELTGASFAALQLSPSLIEQLTSAGITSMSFETEPDGIHISVNGQELPTISWGRGELQNVIDIASQSGLLEAAMPGMDLDSVLQTVENLLPVIQTADANITIFLPGSDMGN